MNVLLIFLVISVTICFADEDGQYELDNSGLYQPGAYGDDGSYIPDYSGQYIPDYSGLYHSDGTGFYSSDRSGDYANKNNFGSSSNVILKSILFAPKKIQPSTNNLVKIDEKKIKQIREAGRASHYYKFKATGKDSGVLDFESPYGGYTNEYYGIFHKN